jgi:hypothetical protein
MTETMLGTALSTLVSGTLLLIVLLVWNAVRKPKK